MIDFVKFLREKFKGCVLIVMLEIVSDYVFIDGMCKWLIDVGNGNVVEIVFILEEMCGMLCVLLQVGCVVNCCFCLMGKQGFFCNLLIVEIIGQFWMVEFVLCVLLGCVFGLNGKVEWVVINVVMMGMGELFLNYSVVVFVM